MTQWRLVPITSRPFKKKPEWEHGQQTRVTSRSCQHGCRSRRCKPGANAFQSSCGCGDCYEPDSYSARSSCRTPGFWNILIHVFSLAYTGTPKMSDDGVAVFQIYQHCSKRSSYCCTCRLTRASIFGIGYFGCRQVAARLLQTLILLLIYKQSQFRPFCILRCFTFSLLQNLYLLEYCLTILGLQSLINFN